MRQAENKYTSSIFENIKHLDVYINEFWDAMKLSKM